MQPREITAEYLRERLDYDPTTGKFFWKAIVERTPRDRGWNKRFSGKVAGGVVGRYYKIHLSGNLLYAHRLAWLYMYGKWPEGIIDHINRSKLDNRIDNLRESNHSENGFNSKVREDNTTGAKGVYWNKQLGRWFARIHKGGSHVHLGCFDDKEDAIQARRKAELEYYGGIRDAA